MLFRLYLQLAGMAVAAVVLVHIPLSQAQNEPPIDLSGVWSTNSLDTLKNPSWDIEGLFSCRCTTETYAYLETLLHDPSHDNMSAEDIVTALDQHTNQIIADRLTPTGREVKRDFDLADDPAIQCEPFGAFRTILHADPIQFDVYEDRIVVIGEDLAADRTIYMDGRGHPDEGAKTITGHSIGWYEGNTLVVETIGISANLAEDQLAIHNSDQARGIERYSVSPDGEILNMQLTIYDPIMFSEPLTIERPRVLSPSVELDRAPCEAISGEFR